MPDHHYPGTKRPNISTENQPDGDARHPRDTLDRPPETVEGERDHERKGEARIGNDG